MRLCTFEIESPFGPVSRLGLKTAKDTILDLNLAYALMLTERDGHPRAQDLADLLVPPNMLAWLQNEQFGSQAVNEALAYLGNRINGPSLIGPFGQQLLHPLAEIKLLAPILRPYTLRDCMLFLEHVKRSMELEGQHEELKAFLDVQGKIPAVFYKGNPNTVVGPDVDIPMYPGETRHDFECEVCCVIGRKGKDITPDKMWDHIAGFSIFNDISGRDQVNLDVKGILGPTKGKDQDGWNQLGPYLVTPDEWDFRDEHKMTVLVNGEVWGGDLTTSISKDPAVALSYISRNETLYPGDVIAFGTVGTGTGEDIGRWPKAGDIVELDVEGLGVLRCRFVIPE